MDIQNLIHCPLFKGLPEQEIQQLLHNRQWQVRAFAQSTVVALRGEACKHLLIVLNGAVQGQMTDDTGKMVVIEDIPAPRPIATAFLYAEQNEFPVTIVALNNTQILFIPKADFTDMLQTSRTLLLNFLQVISDRSRFLSEKILFLNFKTIKRKIAAYLLQQSKLTDSDTIHLSETQQELADSFGVARPSFARTLKEMEDDGLITIQRKQITIVNKERLKKI